MTLRTYHDRERDEESDYPRFYNNKTAEIKTPFPAINICTVTLWISDVMFGRTDFEHKSGHCEGTPSCKEIVAASSL